MSNFHEEGHGHEDGFDPANFRFPPEDEAGIQTEEGRNETSEIRVVSFQEGIEFQIKQPKITKDELPNEDDGRKNTDEVRFEKKGPEGVNKKGSNESNIIIKNQEILNKETIEVEGVKIADTDIEEYDKEIIKKSDEAKSEIEERGKNEGWDPSVIKERASAAVLRVETEGNAYLKEIMDQEKSEKGRPEISDIKWQKNIKETERMIKEKEWRELIPHIGSMNTLDHTRFQEEAAELFDAKSKESLLEELQNFRESEAGVRNEINPMELATATRYLSECFSDLKGRIKLGGKDWKIMKDYLEELQSKDWARKELTSFTQKSEYWKVRYYERNMKIVKEMIKKGEISVSEENDIEQ